MSQAGITKITSSILPTDVLTKVNVQTGTSPVVPTSNTITFNGAVVAAGTNPVRTDGTGPNTMALEVQKSQAIAASDATKIGLAAFDSSKFGVDANGFVTFTGTTTDYHVARYIVSAGGATDGANYTTIASAYAAAVAAGGAQTVFVQPGTYTENITLSANVNICAFDCDAMSPNVTILGKLTGSFAGTVSISGICLQTNADYALEISGASATVIYLKNCFIYAVNNAAIHHTSTNGASFIFIQTCRGNTGGNVAYFVSTSAGAIKIYNSSFEQDASATTASTYSGSGGINFYNSFFYQNITTTGSGSFTCQNCILYAINQTFSLGNSGSTIITNSWIGGGTASALTIGGGVTAIVANTGIDSTNASAIAGTGTLKYGMIVFTNTSSTVAAGVTQTALATLV